MLKEKKGEEENEKEKETERMKWSWIDQRSWSLNPIQGLSELNTHKNRFEDEGKKEENPDRKITDFHFKLHKLHSQLG